MGNNNTIDETNHIIDDLQNKYLSFFILDKLYSVELSSVLEIISIQSITYIPDMPNYIKGIINLRGKIIPIIDIGYRFTKQYIREDSKNCIVIIMIHGEQIGFIVDRVDEVISASYSQITSIPQFSNINNSKFLNYLIKIDDKVVLNIDLYQLFYLENIL